MTDLETRLAELRTQISGATGAERETLLDHVEEVVLTLEGKKLQVPSWARALLAARIDRSVEDQFDNMPI